jgi:hypothetical protein
MVTGEGNIWVGQSGRKYGPYRESIVRAWLAEGKFAANALAWRVGMDSWAPLSQLFPTEPVAAEPFVPATTIITAPPPVTVPAIEDIEAIAMAHRLRTPPPPALHWTLVFLLSLLTLGLFAVAWSYAQARWVRRLDPRSHARWLLTLSLLVLVPTLLFYGAAVAARIDGATIKPDTIRIGLALLAASWLLHVVGYAMMLRTLRRYFGARQLRVRVAPLTLCFFSIWYLQGQLRRVARWKRTGATEPPAPVAVFWLLWVFPLVLAAGIAASIPAYQDYGVRTQVAAGMALGDQAKVAVAAYYRVHEALPGDNKAAGLPEPVSLGSQAVSAIRVVGGRVVVSYGGPGASAAISGTQLVFVPEVVGGGGAFRWHCDGRSTVPGRYLPVACRG